MTFATLVPLQAMLVVSTVPYPLIVLVAILRTRSNRGGDDA